MHKIVESNKEMTNGIEASHHCVLGLVKCLLQLRLHRTHEHAHNIKLLSVTHAVEGETYQKQSLGSLSNSQ